MKTCYRCKKNKKKSSFNKDKQKRDGLYPVCKKCLSKINNPPIYKGSKFCNICKIQKDRKLFDRCKIKGDGLQAYCKECRKFFDKLNLYGISKEEFLLKKNQQNNKCKICGNIEDKRELSVDHNHKTGKVRGLLCQLCNAGIGYFKDSTELLEKALKYLKEYEN